ncbi:hypothetical protein ACFSE1_10040 [Rhizobium helianthi]|uniref:J domain-containing protein n=1 Tax=Rhizobium helianthi TaxID=1132695 RepID=A0ABW4M4A7_9HYPH
MLFGRSVFQSILTRLDGEEEEAEPAAPQSFRVSGLTSGFVAETTPTAAALPQADLAYFDVLEFPAPEPEPPVLAPEPPAMPDHLLRLTEAEIAEDLCLAKEDTPDLLQEKRRNFAKLNHPDRIHPNFRAEATTRMTIANMLIDRAIARQSRR